MKINNTPENAKTVRKIVDARIAANDWQPGYVVETDAAICICDDDEYGEKLAADIEAAM